MPSHKRPRNQISGFGLGPGKEMANSNSTMTQFLGGKTKAWMTQTPVQSRRPPAPQFNPRDAANDSSGEANNVWNPPRNHQSGIESHPSTVRPTGYIDTNSQTGHAELVSELRTLTGTVEEPENSIMIAIATPANSSLPSPSSSDEAQQSGLSAYLAEPQPGQSRIPQSHTEPISRQSTENSSLVNTGRWAQSTPVQETETPIMNTDAITGLSGTICIPSVIALLSDARRSGSNFESIGSSGGNMWPTPPASIYSGGSSVRPSDSASPAVITAQFAPGDLFGSHLQIMFQKISSRLESIRKIQGAHMTVHLEESRLVLLQKACRASDVSFLALHQMFCMFTVFPAGRVRFFDFNDGHLEGIKKMEELILSNTGLPTEAATWFSGFPAPLEVLFDKSIIYRKAYREARNNIELLGRNWDQFKRQYLAKRSPPLIGDMILSLGVVSSVMQHVIYTAMQRLIWVGPQDACLENSEALFSDNLATSRQWHSRRGKGNPPSAEEMASYHLKLVSQYQQIRINHLPHIRQIGSFQVPSQFSSSMLRMGPPQQSLVEHRTSNLHQRSEHVSDYGRSGSTSVESSLDLNGLRPNSTMNEPASVGRRSNDTTVLFGHPGNPTPPRRLSGTGTSTGEATTTGLILRNDQSLHQEHGQSFPSVSFLNNPSQAHSHAPYHSLPLQRAVSISVNQVSRPNVQGQSTTSSNQFTAQGGNNSTAPTARSHSTHSTPTQFNPNFPSAPLVSSPVNSEGFSPGFASPGEHMSSSTNLQTPFQNWPLIPPSSISLSYASQPLLENSSIHQAHLRDPDIVVVDSNSEPGVAKAYYQYLKEFTCEPLVIQPTSRSLYRYFKVSADHALLIPKDEPHSYGGPPRRKICIGSRSLRLRCIKVKNEIAPSDCAWPVEETFWPSNIIMTFNKVNLELRRKAYYGKDLPVDLTALVREGDNELHVAMLRVGQAIDPKDQYAIAVEEIELGDLNSVKAQVRRLEESTVQKQIQKQLSNADPDIEVLGSNVSISVVDPFTSSLIHSPARGKFCRHYECFDLDIFLKTRQGSPCMPEQFRCPICNEDARPECLVIDGWFQGILDSIREMKQTDARTIVIDVMGNWKIREEKGEGESGDGTGARRRNSEDAQVAVNTRKNSELIVID